MQPNGYPMDLKFMYNKELINVVSMFQEIVLMGIGVLIELLVGMWIPPYSSLTALRPKASTASVKSALLSCSLSL